MTKVGDIVFAKTFDVYADEDSVAPAIVTRVYTEEDGEWAKDRNICRLTIFGAEGSTYLDMDEAKGTGDQWESGSFSTSFDGGVSKSPTPVSEPVVADSPFTSTPQGTPVNPEPGSVGDNSPASVSGADTTQGV